MGPHTKAQQSDKAEKAGPSARQPNLRLDPSGQQSQVMQLIQRAKAKPDTLTLQDMAQLQHSLGNKAIGRLLTSRQQSSAANMAVASRKAGIQTKLMVGPAGDQYEQEADRIAHQVVQRVQQANQTPVPDQQEGEIGQSDPLRISRLPVARSAMPNKSGDSQRLVAADPFTHGCEIGGEVEASIRSSEGGGHPLSDSVRSAMENSFQTDFSGVRVHTDSKADTLNHALNARAFTTGSDIFFKRGEYNPASSQGQQLLAHELTHVVQQGHSRPFLQRFSMRFPNVGSDTTPTQTRITTTATINPSFGHPVVQRDYNENLGLEYRVRTTASVEYNGRNIPFNLNQQHQTLRLPANTSGILRLHINSVVRGTLDVLRLGVSRESRGEFAWQVSIDADGQFQRVATLLQDVPVPGNTAFNVLLRAAVRLSPAQDLGANQIGFHIDAARADSMSASGVSASFPESVNHDFRITIEADPKTVQQHKGDAPQPPVPITVPSTLLHRSVFFNREGRTTLSDGTGREIGQYADERGAAEQYIEELRAHSELWSALTEGNERIRISVIGFSSPPGTADSNEQVSIRRANNVAMILRNRFVNNPGAGVSVGNHPWRGNSQQQALYQSLTPEERERVNQQLRVVEIEISESDARIAIDALRRRRGQATQLGGGHAPGT